MPKSSFPFRSSGSPIRGTRGMVATSQPLAVQAGLEMLAKGGSAADAAVAMAAALNVTEPTSTGLGGDCFALYFRADTQEINALNGSGRAPHMLTLQRLHQQGYADALPPFHAHTITVPGACAGWCDLVERYGKLSLSTIFEPAIRLAEQGFPVAPITAYFWDRGVKRQLSQAPGGSELTLKGRAPRAGETFQNPGLAKTLKTLAELGPQAFYHGEIAAAIVQAVQKAGGLLDLEDLANHKSTWDQPISTSYRGIRLWECPPNGQGLAALLALNILEGFDVASLPPLGARRLHLVIEALRLAFADAGWFVADPSFGPIPLDELLSKGYADARRAQIQTKQANLDFIPGSPRAGSDTVYLTVVDTEGNACSFINSNYMGFGTGIVPKGWGFTLQNRGHNFNLDPNHPNALAPRKRPYHTIIPALATHKDGSLYASFGVMGGFMQPQGHVQVLMALIDDALDPQQSLDRPRLCLVDGRADSDVALEEGIAEDVMDQLQGWGHSVHMVSGFGRAIFGRGQIIQKDPENGVLWGGSDPRADGCAANL